MSLKRLAPPLLVMAAVSALLWLMSRPRPLREEAPPPMDTADAPPTPAPPVQPASAAEAQAKLDLAFKNTLSLDLGETPPLTAGDFNADGSMDLALAVRPRKEGLAELNGELPAWLTQDVTLLLDPRGSPPPPVRIREGEPLLAIVHGIDAPGWRHPDALQGYLLVKARGRGMRSMTIAEAAEVSGAKASNPRLGDVLAEVVDGRAGFLVWTAGQYLWRALPPGRTVAARAP
jgi:hypothetical protein